MPELPSPKSASGKESVKYYYPSLGLTMAVGMGVFAFLGHLVDKRWPNEHNWGVLGGIFLGLFYCGYEIWKLTRDKKDASL